MANTLSSDLIVDILSEVSITTLGPVLGIMDSFTTDLSADAVAPRSTFQVDCVTGGSTTLTNPDSFETGDSTVEARPVTGNHISQPFHVTAQQMNQGFRLKNLLAKNMQVFANSLHDIIMTPVTEAVYGTAVLDKTLATFTAADLPTIWAAGKNLPQKNLILEGSFYAKIMPTDTTKFNPADQGAYGFDRIAYSNRFTAAGTDVVGFLADPNALLVASGVPVMDEDVTNAMVGQEQVTLSNGLTVQLNSWVSTGTRAKWASLDVILGAAVGDAAAGMVIEGGTD